jgi:hypothetical protein
MRRARIGLAIVAVAVLMATALAPARVHRHHAPRPTQFSLAGGCYSMQLGPGRQLGPFRMQAAALSQYLLYNGQFLAPDLSMSDSPSIWTVAPGGRSISNGGTKLGVTFVPASGCPAYPEAQVDATGTPAAGRSPEASVRGTVEGHAHVTAFELFGGDWHCGRPWSPFGAPSALPASCAAAEQGTNGATEAFLDFGGLSRPAGMHGWPTFVAWPSPTAVAEEGDYWTAIERAWKAGLRVLVTNLVDNEALCSLMTTRHSPCNDMSAVQIQSRDLYALQDYIDAQSGGPGKGFFRIVTDPFQARRVINQGKLAVIEGIEVSRIFGCGEVMGVPQCDQSQIDAGLNLVRSLGVRTFFPVHEFNNAFGGTKMIAGDTGAIINAGNRTETGSFWTLEPCPATQQDAEQLTVPASGPLAQLLNGPVSTLLHGNPLPIYGQGPQCNTQGLTGLGAYLIGQMIKDHFIIQLDHMDSKTATAALAIAQSQHYSGVVSAHCCSSPQLFPGVYATGGFVTEPQTEPEAFVNIYKQDKLERSNRYAFGFGYGSDMNGLAQQAGPDSADPIHYPFKSFDGRVTFTREQWGQRTFDLNTDGLANYGMYADWLQALGQVGGRPFLNDMFNGAEAYLEMWERASGVPSEHCLTRAQVRLIRRGQTWVRLLYLAGQPVSRSARVFSYCRTGGGSLTVRFSRRGRVTAARPG